MTRLTHPGPRFGRRLAFLAGLGLSVAAVAGPAPAAERAADGPAAPVVESVSGTVEVRVDQAQAWRRASPGMLLAAGATVRTGPASRAAVRHAGGVIWLFDHTLLRLPVETAGRLRWIRRPELLSGQALFEVDAVRLGALLARVKAGSRSPFEVVTPHVVAGVKGTAFLVVEREADSYVCVMSGRVLVADLAGRPAQTALLGRGQVADYHGGRLEGTHTLPDQEAWTRWVREEAGGFTAEAMTGDGWFAR